MDVRNAAARRNLQVDQRALLILEPQALSRLSRGCTAIAAGERGNVRQSVYLTGCLKIRDGIAKYAFSADRESICPTEHVQRAVASSSQRSVVERPRIKFKRPGRFGNSRLRLPGAGAACGGKRQHGRHSRDPRGSAIAPHG